MEGCLIPFQFPHVPRGCRIGHHESEHLEKNELKTKYNSKFICTCLDLLTFQNNSFIVTFLYSIFTIWKRFLQTRLTCTRGVPTIKVKIFGKFHFFQERLLSP